MPISTLRCLKMRFSVSSPSMSSSTLGKCSQNFMDVLEQAWRHVLMHAAGAEIVGVHAAPETRS